MDTLAEHQPVDISSHPDGQHIAACTCDGNVMVWQLEQGGGRAQLLDEFHPTDVTGGMEEAPGACQVEWVGVQCGMAFAWCDNKSTVCLMGPAQAAEQPQQGQGTKRFKVLAVLTTSAQPVALAFSATQYSIMLAVQHQHGRATVYQSESLWELQDWQKMVGLQVAAEDEAVDKDVQQVCWRPSSPSTIPALLLTFNRAATVFMLHPRLRRWHQVWQLTQGPDDQLSAPVTAACWATPLGNAELICLARQHAVHLYNVEQSDTRGFAVARQGQVLEHRLPVRRIVWQLLGPQLLAHCGDGQGLQAVTVWGRSAAGAWSQFRELHPAWPLGV